MDLTDYIEQLYGGEDDLLRRMRQEAAQEGVPSIQVPFSLGQLLQVLVSVSGARSILEIGTLFGYSAVLMGRALAGDGRMLCLEVSSKHADIARRNIETAGLSSRVEIRQGNALDLLPTLQPQTFDFIFIDADKPGYPDYLEWALRLSRTGSVIVADNVWRNGEVLTDADKNAQAMATFNRLVAQNARLRTAIVPRTDGSDAASISVVTE
jgi:caffeoyl-CoA O-methyltransferase